MDFSAIRELETKYAIKTAIRQNVCFVSGEGNTLFDTNNRAYLDLACGRGESCLGYSHPQLSAAIAHQSASLLAISDEYFSEPYVSALAKLIDGTGFTKGALTGSAADAAIMSLALLRSHVKKKGDGRNRLVIASDTYYDEPKGQGQGNMLKRVFVEFNNFEALKEALTPQTAALIVEPIISDGGVKSASYDYLINAYVLCKSMGILFFCDETRIGIGRTGAKFAFEHYGIQPDLVAISRGLGGGLPIGAVLTRDALAESYKPSERALGSGAGVLSCVAAGIVLDRLSGDALKDIAEMGEYLLAKLCKLNKYNFVLDVRGKGLLAAVELSSKIMAAKVVSQIEKQGFLFSYTDGNVVRLSPSFTVTQAEIDKGVDALVALFSSTNI